MSGMGSIVNSRSSQGISWKTRSPARRYDDSVYFRDPLAGLVRSANLARASQEEAAEEEDFDTKTPRMKVQVPPRPNCLCPSHEGLNLPVLRGTP